MVGKFPRKFRKKLPYHKQKQTFLIIAEGEREDNYFGWFGDHYSSLRVEIVPRENGKSAPKHFLERFERYKKKWKWLPGEGDQLWFILDVDRWKRDEIETLIHHCQTEEQFNIAISNPCFEVWLHFHCFHEPAGKNCNELKARLGKSDIGGFDPERFCPQIELAITNAKNKDSNSNNCYPGVFQTKVYLLAEQLKIWMKE